MLKVNTKTAGVKACGFCILKIQSRVALFQLTSKQKLIMAQFSLAPDQSTTSSCAIIFDEKRMAAGSKISYCEGG